MYIHNYLENSRVNGPGLRFVLWTQGCSIRCSHCFNPETHEFKKDYNLSVSEILEKISEQNEIEGITISGGEPFDQKKELLRLVENIKKNTSLSILVYSGYTFDVLNADSLGKLIVENIDVLIDGRYMNDRSSINGNMGSINQNHYFLTNRYSASDFVDLNSVEYHINTNGEVFITGFPKL